MTFKERNLYAIWAAAYPLVAGLGFLSGVGTAAQVVLFLLGLAFFAPGFLLLRHGLQEGGKPVLRRLRILSAIVLGATMLAVIGNVLSAYAVNADGLGIFLHIILVLVSVPMYCMQYRIVALFLWACLLVATFTKPVKK